MKEQSSLYWIGVRESEIYNTNGLFKGSITTYGSNMNGNYSFDKTYNWRYDCNTDNEMWMDFINEKCKQIIAYDQNAKFLLYYSPEYPYLDPEIKTRVLCNNNETIVNFLDNKISTRIWVSEFAETTPYVILEKERLTFKYLRKRFPKYTSFVVQHCESSGGSGTILLNQKNAKSVIKDLPNKTYLISPYIENNISINTHIIVYEDEVLFFPPSVQLIKNTNGHLSYVGNDFDTYNELNSDIKNQIRETAIKIGNNLRKIGYLGVCGIDFIATKDKAIFMEINPRFQASTVLINKYLSAEKYSFTIQHLQLDAFLNSKCSYDFSNLNIKYSLFFYKYHNEFAKKIKYCHKLALESTTHVECVDDYLDWDCKIDESSYLYSIILNRNISCISPDNNSIISQNIDIYDSEIINVTSLESNLLELKIMLLNQGVRLSNEAINYLSSNGGLNYKEFQAVDMKIFGKFFNVPIMTQFTHMSPFEIDLSNNNEIILKYYGDFLAVVGLRSKNQLGDCYICKGIIADDITYLSNDRLRIFFRSGCYFKEHNIGCKFCDVENTQNIFTIEDIMTAIDVYSNCENVKHYLIGGGSESPNSNFGRIIEIANYLRKKSDKKISIMTIPPKNINIIRELKAAGINEIVFNIEIFDRNIASSIMPGKGAISLENYDIAFKESLKCFGKGNVRSMLIVGLERRSTFLDGIEHLCSLGVSPTLSLFKPIEGTDMEKQFPPSNIEVLELYHKVESICRKYNITLGPNCRYCEDNTIKVSY